MNSKYDVLIVGAGAAGLAAGRLIADAGLRAAILEARNRVGGRIHTRHVDLERGGAAIPVELGAEFVHGLPRVTWDIAGAAKLAAYELDGSALTFAHGQWSTLGEEPSASHRVLEDMIEWLAKRPGCDMTFAEYLRASAVDASSAEAAANYIEGFNAADKERIGIASLAQQQRAEDAIDTDRLFRIAAGYDAIPKYLSAAFSRAGGELVLEAAVHRVDWKRDAVLVHALNAAGTPLQFRAKRALITVPLGVLQAESIEFTPRPAEILAQAHRLAMGAALRVVLIFRERFWCARRGPSVPRSIEHQLDNLSFLFSPSDLPATWWTPMPERTPMLTAWVGGPRAAALLRSVASSGDRRRLLTQCLSALANIFGIPLSDLEKLVVSWHTHDWLSDEYARGAYSYVPAGALDAPERMTRPLEDTLYFAGEHTDLTGHWGTVHAALSAGARAAAKMLHAEHP
jgi:monoamine oxidase